MSSPENQTWYAAALRASEIYNKILNESGFKTGNDLGKSQIDELLRQMRSLANNRNLGSQLYTQNGIANFNQRLRELLFGKSPLPKRIDQFFGLSGIREVTASHFLALLDPKEYAFYSRQTYQVLNLTSEQEDQASS